jgi:hypothetical protein
VVGSGRHGGAYSIEGEAHVTEAAGDSAAGIGTAIVSYIEPHPDAARAFNQWYERDHFPSAVLAGPGVYAGARYVATRACKVVRADGDLLGEPQRGSYLAVAWIEPGAQVAWDAWIPTQMDALVAADRMFAGRDHLHTAVYDFVWSVERPAVGPPSLALTAAHRGVIVIALTGDDDVRDWSAARLDAEVPTIVNLRRSRLLVSTLGEPADHSLLLVFVTGDPQDVWTRAIAPAVHARADVGFAGPFLATIPGTDEYVDDL